MIELKPKSSFESTLAYIRGHSSDEGLSLDDMRFCVGIVRGSFYEELQLYSAKTNINYTALYSFNKDASDEEVLNAARSVAGMFSIYAGCPCGVAEFSYEEPGSVVKWKILEEP